RMGPRNAIARLQPDGMVDLSFDTQLTTDHSVTAAVVQPDGRIIIAGSFDTVQGVNRRGLARLGSDGSLDLSFEPGAGIGERLEGSFEPSVAVLALDSQGQLAVGGNFTALGAVLRRNVGRVLTGLAPSPPRIVSQPQSRTVDEGQTVSLLVVAAG